MQKSYVIDTDNNMIRKTTKAKMDLFNHLYFLEKKCSYLHIVHSFFIRYRKL